MTDIFGDIDSLLRNPEFEHNLSRKCIPLLKIMSEILDDINKYEDCDTGKDTATMALKEHVTTLIKEANFLKSRLTNSIINTERHLQKLKNKEECNV